VDARLRGAFADPDPVAGLRKAKALATELDKTHPDAAGSLREGLEDMFTVRRLGIDGTLARTLVCTNMIESMIGIARTTTRNVKTVAGRRRHASTVVCCRAPRSREEVPTRTRPRPDAPPRRRSRPSRRSCHTGMSD
jgi:hypothetical protein